MDVIEISQVHNSVRTCNKFVLSSKERQRERTGHNTKVPITTAFFYYDCIIIIIFKICFFFSAHRLLDDLVGIYSYTVLAVHRDLGINTGHKEGARAHNAFCSHGRTDRQPDINKYRSP